MEISPIEMFCQALYAEQAGDYTQALEILSILLEYDPDDIGTRVRYAANLAFAGKPLDAIRLFHEVLAEDPKCEMAHRKLAGVCFLLGLDGDGEKHLEWARQCPPIEEDEAVAYEKSVRQLPRPVAPRSRSYLNRSSRRK